MSFPYPIITLEEHWRSQHIAQYYTSQNAPDPNSETGLLQHIIPSLNELGSIRLSSMDSGNVTVQIISHAPNSIAIPPTICTAVNNELHKLITAHTSPTRFAAFATLPMSDPRAAATELHRCITQLGFLGTLIDSNTAGHFYDSPTYHPVFAAAESLDVPIYLHPAPNPATQDLLYSGNYPSGIAETLSQYAWGWHNETATHFLKLFAAGVFDKFPRLKLVLGHMGEMLPFQLDRIEGITTRGWPHLGVKLERGLRQVWDENVWITTSGMFFMAPMAAVLRQCKPDRIMHSVDYPFGSNEAGTEFLRKLRTEGMVTDEVLEGIAYKNAERLLRIKAVRV